MPEGNKAIIDIDVREGDGVYLIIDNPADGPPAARKDILELIERYAVQDIDFMKITAIFKMTDLHIEECISHNTNVSRTPEQIIIEVAKDKMKATIRFEPPVNNGPAATVERINKAIEQAGIRFGVPEGLVEKLAFSRDYDMEYVIAKGKVAEDGVNGYVEYHFNEKKKSYKPKEAENGKVDYRNLDLIEMAYKGKILLTIHDPIPGSNGINVLGQLATARLGKPVSHFTAGKNVMESEDGKQFIATADGQILLEGRKVSVSPLLEIAGNVDNSTGNIDFNGSIVIHGNVLTGFSVSAVGNIEVIGVVEGARITSEHSIILYAGIQGNERAEIIAGESITTKYAEHCSLEAGGDIISDSIMHSNVICGGILTLKGRNGLLVGGKTRVAGRLEAQTIGSIMATSTEIEVGLDPQKLMEFRTLQSEFGKVKDEYEKHDRLFMALHAAMKRGALPVEKKVLLLKTINLRNALRARAEVIQDRIKDILPRLEGEGDVVIVSKTMHPGVRLLIGNAAMHVHSQIDHSKLKNTGGKIEIMPLY